MACNLHAPRQDRLRVQAFMGIDLARHLRHDSMAVYVPGFPK